MGQAMLMDRHTMESIGPPFRQRTAGWAPGQETAVQPTIVSFANCGVSRSGGRSGMGAWPRHRDVRAPQRRWLPHDGLPMQLV